MSALHSHSLATIAFQPAASEQEEREFTVLVQHQGESVGYHKTIATHGFDAWFEFHEKFPEAVRIEVLS